MRNVVTRTLQAQDMRKGMVFTNGQIVGKIAKIVPMNLTGIVVKDENGVRVEPTYTHVQILTKAGHLLNVKISDEFKVRAYVKL